MELTDSDGLADHWASGILSTLPKHWDYKSHVWVITHMLGIQIWVLLFAQPSTLPTEPCIPSIALFITVRLPLVINHVTGLQWIPSQMLMHISIPCGFWCLPCISEFWFSICVLHCGLDIMTICFKGIKPDSSLLVSGPSVHHLPISAPMWLNCLYFTILLAAKDESNQNP